MHHNPRCLRHEASERQAASTQQLTALTLDRWGTNKEFKVSKVVDRLASERSRVPFMADPKKA